MPRYFEPEYSDLPIEVLREMSGEERLRIAMELTSKMRRKLREGICENHPDWENWQKKVEFMRCIFHPEPLPRGFEEHMRERADPNPPGF